MPNTPCKVVSQWKTARCFFQIPVQQKHSKCNRHYNNKSNHIIIAIKYQMLGHYCHKHYTGCKKLNKFEIIFNIKKGGWGVLL